MFIKFHQSNNCLTRYLYANVHCYATHKTQYTELEQIIIRQIINQCYLTQSVCILSVQPDPPPPPPSITTRSVSCNQKLIVNWCFQLFAGRLDNIVRDYDRSVLSGHCFRALIRSCRLCFSCNFQYIRWYKNYCYIKSPVTLDDVLGVYIDQVSCISTR